MNEVTDITINNQRRLSCRPLSGVFRYSAVVVGRHLAYLPTWCLDSIRYPIESIIVHYAQYQITPKFTHKITYSTYTSYIHICISIYMHKKWVTKLTLMTSSVSCVTMEKGMWSAHPLGRMRGGRWSTRHTHIPFGGMQDLTFQLPFVLLQAMNNSLVYECLFKFSTFLSAQKH